MSRDLEALIADAQARHQAAKQTSGSDIDQMKAALSEHVEKMRLCFEIELEERIMDFKCIRTTAFAAANLAQQVQKDHQALAEKIATSEVTLRRQARRAWFLQGGAIVAAGVIVLLAIWMAAGITSAAGREADAIRAMNARELAAVRENGRREVANLHAAFVDQRLALEAEIAAAGIELAALTAEQEAVRADLDTFAALRARLGISLVETRTQPVIVVPEGQELRAWGAPGLSDLATYNGRMYRLVSTD